MIQLHYISDERNGKKMTEYKNVIGIDVGGSTTKIVGFKKSGSNPELITPF